MKQKLRAASSFLNFRLKTLKSEVKLYWYFLNKPAQFYSRVSRVSRVSISWLSLSAGARLLIRINEYLSWHQEIKYWILFYITFNAVKYITKKL